MMIYRKLQYCTSGQAYFFDPVDKRGTGNEVLAIDRQNGTLSLKDDVPKSLLSTSQPKLIYGILGIMHFYTGYKIILIKSINMVGSIGKHAIYKISETEILSCTQSHSFPMMVGQLEDEIYYTHLLSLFLSHAEIYFSYTLDLTRSLQHQSEKNEHYLWKNADTRYFSNRFVSSTLIDFAENNPHLKAIHSYIIPCIEGFIGTISCYIHSDEVKMTLLSRRQWMRAGTRYHSRGINHHGYVSNFVETEQIVMINDQIGSYVQCRGSIPVFWRQQVNLKYAPPLDISSTTTTNAVFEKHFEMVSKAYSTVYALDLTNGHGMEGRLTKAFGSHIQSLNEQNIKYLHFDFHHHCRKDWGNLKLLMDQIYESIAQFGYYLAYNHDHHPVHVQSGVFRTNCIDCLDRTNVVQTLIAKMIIIKQLKDMKTFKPGETIENFEEFYFLFRNLWADNADALSRSYSGTGALKTDYTRAGVRTYLGIFSDFQHSVVRYVRGNFLDAKKQDAMDLFYGKHLMGTKPSIRGLPPSAVFYFGIGSLLFSFIALLFTLLLTAVLDSSASINRYFLMIFAFLLFTFNFIYKNGEFFVSLPSLTHHEFQDLYEENMSGSYNNKRKKETVELNAYQP